VEPDTGEVALLRPDITPQIARVIATRLADRAPPWRLCYEGTVIRRRRGRARRHRQIAQAGVECVGLPGAAGDAEVILLALRACSAVGLEEVRVELGLVQLGRAALGAVPEALRDEAEDALAGKDRTELERLLDAGQVRGADRAHLLGLTELYGGLDVLDRATKLFASRAERTRLDELRELADHLAGLGLRERLLVDLGEVRGAAYYTGASFALLAEGPGEPIGAGGRYDQLLGRFGAPAPATGFALALDNLQWALGKSGNPWVAPLPPRVAIAGPAREIAADAIRARGIDAATLPGDGLDVALAFARSWGYDAALVAGANAWQVVGTDGVVADAVSDADTLRVWLGME
jgi:ATP phosphoribosyltransferase regulatory subunit